MTVEELRAEANALGYNIIKKPEPLPKLLPCSCGSVRRERWVGTGSYNKVIIRCSRCGKMAYGKNERKARENWNKIAPLEGSGE